jgi:mRNA interferase MazF
MNRGEESAPRRGEVWWAAFGPSAGGEIHGEAYVTVNGVRHKAMADQLTTASKSRLRELMGKLTANGIFAVERAIKVQLALT